MISVEKIETLQGLDGLRTDWDRLLAKSDFRNIFLTFGWLRTWWAVFGDDKELYVLAVRSDAEVIGIAPFMLEKGRRFGRMRKVIRFIGTPNADYGDFIGQDKKLLLAHIAEYLIRNRKDWTRVELAQISERSSTLAVIQSIIKSGDLLSTTKKIETCFSYVYDGDEANRSAFTLKKNRTIKTAINVLGRNKGLTLERISDLDLVHMHLTVLFSLHMNRWSDTPTPSKFIDARNRKFYHQLIDALGPSGRIYFIMLRNGDVPVACCLSFGYEKTINLYTIAMNPYFHKRSPGLLFFTLQAEILIRQGFTLDYSRGAQQYKSVLTNRHSTNYQVTIFRKKSDYLRTTVYENIKKGKAGRLISGNPKVQYYKLRFTSLLRRRGIRGLILKIIASVLESIVDYKTFYLFRHDGRQETVPSPRIDVEIKMLGIEDADQIATFYGVREGSAKHKTVIERFENRAACFAAFHNGNIVYLSWTLFGEDFWSDYNLSVKPESDEVVFSDALASPIYRGMGLYTHVLAYKLNKYSREGYRPLSAVAKSNTPALKATAKFGFRRLRTYRKLKFFSRWVL